MPERGIEAEGRLVEVRPRQTIELGPFRVELLRVTHSMPDCLALAIHTATVLGKLLSESVENIDEGVVEAIRATGAGYTQILSFAVLPQILPDLISFTLYRLETNIRAASVLGLIGAGGIGYLMNTSFRTFQYQEAAAIVLVLIALVMLVDYLSSRLRTLVV